MKRIVSMLFLVLFSLIVMGLGSAWAQTNNASERAKLKFGPNSQFKAPFIGLPRITGSSSVDVYVVEDFEGGVFPPTGWTRINPDTSYTWEDTSASSYGVGVSSAFINNYDYSTAPALDSLITPTITGVLATDSIKFDYAYTDYSPTFSDDSLFVDISTDNGATWTSLWREGGAGLRTRPSTTAFFIPTPSEWATKSLPVPAGVVGANVKVAFISRSNFGNNLFIDQVRIGNPPPPPLSGLKTIGGASPDYATVKAAVQALNSLGVQAPGVTFLIRSGTYAEDSLRIRTATSSAAAPIVFKPDVGATVVINVSPPNTTYNFAIKVDTTQYVTFDGSNNGTTSRDMTINTVGTNGQRGIWVSGASHYATIKNCNITAGRDIASPTTSVIGIDFRYTGATQDPDFVVADNNLIRYGYTGIRLEGWTAGDVMESPVVRNNVIDSVGNAGVYTLYHNDARIYGNDVNIRRGSAATMYGIFIGSTTARTRVYSNRVHDINQLSTTSFTYGIYASGTSTLASHAIFNNFVWGISSPVAATGAIYGVYDGVGNTTIADTIAYNTVALTGSSTGNKTTAAFFKGSATGPAYVYNNVFQNTRTDGTTGVAVAIYKTTAPTVLNSNNNDLYVGTLDAQHFTGRISTTNYATIADWRTANASDASSFAENPPFVSATDLHMQTGVPTQLESAGTPIAGITIDIDNDARNGTTPDIGADEFAGIAVDLTPPLITYTPLPPTNQTTNRTLAATITDASGVPTIGIGLPVLYWRINSGAYTGATGSFVSGNDYSFTFGVGVAVGDTVSYFVAAQDNATPPNVSVQPSTGAGGLTANPPAASTPPTTPSFYFVVQAPLASGDYTVGLAIFQRVTGKKFTVQSFTRKVLKEIPAGAEIDHKAVKSTEYTSGITPYEGVELREVEEVYNVLMDNGRQYEGPTRIMLDDAQRAQLGYSSNVLGIYLTITAAVNDLNLRGVSGSVRFLLTDATYPSETFPITINVVSDSVPTALKTVTIKPNTGVTATVAGASASGSIFRILRTNYVTIDGSNALGGSSRDLTIQNASATAPQVVLFGSSGTTPITNGTLKNTHIVNGAVTSSAVIVSDGAVAGTAGYFNDMTIQNNHIRKAYIGVYSSGGTVPQNGSNLLYDSNTLTPVGADSIRYVGLYIQGVNGATVRGNDIGWFSTVTSEDDKSMWLATGTINAVVERNAIHDLNYTGTGGYGGHGMYISSGQTSANIVVRNNMIANLSGDGWNYTTIPTDNPIGIVFTGTQTGVSAYFNSIHLYGNTLNQTNALSMGIYLGTGSLANLRNNVIVNNLGLLATTGYGATGIYAATSNAQFAAINNNDYFTNAGAPTLNIIGKIGATDYTTLPAWAAASGGDLQSVSVNANFLSPTDLHVDTTLATPLDGGAVTIAGTTDDFDGQVRNVTTPDIGADEFTYTPPTTHDIGVSSLTRVASAQDTVRFSALVRNFGGFDEPTYNVIWSVDGITQATVPNSATLEIGDIDTLFFEWSNPTLGAHTAQAWTVLGTDADPSNDSAATSFTVSQALPGGTYTIGAGGNFPTLDSAFTKLEIDGISGPVTFTITDNALVAPGEPLKNLKPVTPEFVTINGLQEEIATPSAFELNSVDTVAALTLTGPIAGASATNRILFRPAAVTAVTITGNGAHVIRLLDAGYVTFDGINSGGASLTIRAVAGAGIILDGNSDHCILRNLSFGTPSFTAMLLATTAGASPDSVLIAGNTVGSYSFNGVFLVNGTTIARGIRITGNSFGTATDSIAQAGVILAQVDGVVVDNNIIQNVVKSALTGNTLGIGGQTKILNARVYNNVIRNVARRVGTAASTTSGITVFGAAGDTTAGWFYNNMIYGLDNQSTSTTGLIRGIYVSTGINDVVAYNSVYLTGTDQAAIITSALTVGFPTATANQVWRNNISINARTSSSTGRALALYSNTTSGQYFSNWNDLYVPTQTGSHVAAVTTTNYTTLAAWQAAGRDSNSANVMANFIAPGLHIDSTLATPINGGATPIAGITTDIDGQSRNATTPDIGADEFSFPVPTEQRKDHVTSAFRATVTNEGTIGSLNAFVGTGPGSGFRFNPVTTAGQRLFGDGIMIALDSTRVSDGVRTNASNGAYDADFKFLTALDSVTTGNRTTMTTSFTDSLAETPFGARVNQRTVSWDSAGIDNFLIFELDIVNTSATPWTTLHAGGLFDWDVDPATANDRGAVVVDSTNTIPGVNSGNPFAFDMLEMHQGASPNSWMGVVPLNENRFSGRRIAISSSEIYPTAHVTNGDKWRYMIGNRATNPNGDAGSAVDHAQVFGSGPYSVAAGATQRIGFAMFGGTSLANAVAAARAAQRAWVQRLGNTIDVTIVGVKDETAGLPEVFDLAQNYPNPFNPVTTIRYALPTESFVTLKVYNVLGQEIATLMDGGQQSGYFTVEWDGRNQFGSPVASGVYFYRIEARPADGASPFTSIKKMLMIK